MIGTEGDLVHDSTFDPVTVEVDWLPFHLDTEDSVAVGQAVRDLLSFGTIPRRTGAVRLSDVATGDFEVWRPEPGRLILRFHCVEDPLGTHGVPEPEVDLPPDWSGVARVAEVVDEEVPGRVLSVSMFAGGVEPPPILSDVLVVGATVSKE